MKEESYVQPGEYKIRQNCLELEKKLAVAEEALTFYACENNWHLTHIITDCGEYSCCHREKFIRAKEALAKIRGERIQPKLETAPEVLDMMRMGK